MNRLLLYLILLLVLVSLQAGISYSHLMQWPGKLVLTGPEYVRVQNVLIQYKMGVGLLEVPTLLLLPLLLYSTYQHRSIFRPLLLAAVCLVLPFGIWLLFIEPINVTVRNWTVSTLPADWPVLRLHWHRWHGGRLVLFVLALLSVSHAIVQAGMTAARVTAATDAETYACPATDVTRFPGSARQRLFGLFKAGRLLLLTTMISVMAIRADGLLGQPTAPPQRAVRQTVTAYIEATDDQNPARLDSVLHPNYQTVWNRFYGDSALVFNREQYRYHVKRDDIGGVPRTIQFDAIRIVENIAQVIVILESRGLTYTCFISLIQDTKGHWWVVGDLPHMKRF